MIVSMYYILTVTVCGMLLISCSNHEYKTVLGPYNDDIGRILEYSRHIKELSNEGLVKEYQTMRRHYDKDKNNINALRFSLLLIYLDAENQNKSYAIELLESAIEQSKNSSVRNLSVLLRDMLVENEKKEILYDITNRRLNDVIEDKRKQESSQEVTNKKLENIIKENRKKEIEYKKLYEKLNEKEQMVEKLQQKIEELKAIERSINERKNTKAPTT